MKIFKNYTSSIFSFNYTSVKSNIIITLAWHGSCPSGNIWRAVFNSIEDLTHSEVPAPFVDTILKVAITTLKESRQLKTRSITIIRVIVV